MPWQASFEPHLVIHETTLPPGGEWTHQSRGWSFLQVQKGMGYWWQAKTMQELFTGSVLILPPEVRAGFRSSQLGEAVLNYFSMEPEKLIGLLSLAELRRLQQATESTTVRCLPPGNAFAERFRALREACKGDSFSCRLQMVQLFADFFARELAESSPAPSGPLTGQERLRQMLREMATSDFLEISLQDLAPRVRCSKRHLNRLFMQELGMSFREKQTQLRLARACQMLESTDAKVIDVAQASGYKSNSLFSLVFKKRFGLSPGQWREQKRKARPRRQRSALPSPL